ncbi:MAG: efflux RND transporter periplasmic adaptor subunit [Planctomycetota bacterium]|jgi:multidrug efflux pump subunit AcrA (membrane-fusion protein)
MSSEQSIDPNLVEQTKQQIRMLVNEIAQLAKSDLSPDEFYGEFLPRVISALAANGGAVWVAESGGRLALGYQVNLHETRLRDDEEGQIRHGRLLQKVLMTGEGSLAPPRSGSGEDDQGGNPTDFLLVMAPLKAAEETVGVVEIFQRPDTRPATQKGYLRFLVEMCDRAGEFFKSHQLKHFTDRQALWTQLEEFARNVHSSLNPRDTAYTIANEGRRLIECDRVSVALRRGRRCKIEAVSGQDLFDKRSNTVQMLGRLASAVVASGEPMWYTGDTSNMAPQVEDAVQEYVDESHSKTVAVLPLQRPEPPEDADEDPDKRPEPPPPIGALIVEQIEDARVPQTMLHRVDVVADHSSTALANAMEHSSLFLLPLWRTIGKARWLVKARTLPKTFFWTSIILAVILFFSLFPWDFNMSADGTVQPVSRNNVFANMAGVISEIPPEVRHAAWVNEGDLLARLDDPDLNIEKEGLEKDLATTEARIGSLEREVNLQDGRGADPAEQRNKRTELKELRLSLGHIQSQLAIYRQKEKQLEIRSPAPGRIGTGFADLPRLMNHPVKRGDLVMWVFDPKGKWHLEILMAEDQMGHIRQAQIDQGKEDLRAVFILATDPATSYEGKIKQIDLGAEVRGDEGNTVLVKVEITDPSFWAQFKDRSKLRPGAGVTAKVYCGRRAVGYVMFHKLIAFVRSRIIFPWF